MRLIPIALLFVVTVSAVSPKAGVSSVQSAGAPCSNLSAVRQAVWTEWYAGNIAALRRLVPADVVALDPDGSWHSLDAVLAGSRAFAKHGKLVSLEFPRVIVHRSGNVAVMYSAYRATITYDGRPHTTQGRATEEFSLRGSCWYNTGWHLDQGRNS